MAALVPAAADAGTYPMYSCNAPGHETGSRVPWTVVGQVGTTVSSMSGYDGCASGGWFGLENMAPAGALGMDPGARGGIRLSVPAGYSIGEVKSWLYAATVNAGSPAIALVQMNGSDYPLWSSPTTVDRTAAASPWVQSVPAGINDFWWQLKCSGATTGQTCGLYSANPLELQGAEVTVSESENPTATLDGGTLTTAGAKKGAKTVRVVGSDARSGVKKLEVLLDDTVMGTIDYGRDWSKPLSAQRPGTCRYDDWSACPTSQSNEFSIDTTTVADGAYALSVRTTDAAGNVKTTVQPGVITIDNTAPTAPAATSPLNVTTQAASTDLTWSHPNNQLSPIVAAHLVVTGASGATQDQVVAVNGATGGATLNRFDGYGTYTVKVGLEDETGNYDATQTRDYRVTFTQPAAAQPTPTPISVDPVTPLPGPAGPQGNDGGPGAPGAAGAAGAAGISTVLHLNGSNATANATVKAAFVGSSRRGIVSAYGKKVALTGQLVAPGGAPIAGAKITVLMQDKLLGATMTPTAEVVTDPDGRFRYVTTATRSRTIRFAYRTHLEDTTFAQTTDVSLGVIAKVALTTDKKALRNGQTVRFLGSVAGAPANARKVVELQVKKRTRWMTFKTTRLRKGRFSAPYRFTSTHGRVTYTFRARVREEAGFPFSTGTSRSTKVTVRG